MYRFFFIFLALSLFSGCQVFDAITEKMDEVKQVAKTVQELQASIEATKKDLDAKLQEIQETREALSKVFGTSQNTPEMEDLRKHALELQKRLDELESQNINSLQDSSEFSIE